MYKIYTFSKTKEEMINMFNQVNNTTKFKVNFYIKDGEKVDVNKKLQVKEIYKLLEEGLTSINIFDEDNQEDKDFLNKDFKIQYQTLDMYFENLIDNCIENIKEIIPSFNLKRKDFDISMMSDLYQDYELYNVENKNKKAELIIKKSYIRKIYNYNSKSKDEFSIKYTYQNMYKFIGYFLYNYIFINDYESKLKDIPELERNFI